MTPATPEELARFMSYVDKLPNGCWFWSGGRSRGKGNKKWYGTFWFRGKSIRAHRFSCDHIGKFEPLPPGHHRDHTCCFSLCVNPEHLDKCTHEENQERKVQRLAAGTMISDEAKHALVQFVLEEPQEWREGMLTVGYGC